MIVFDRGVFVSSLISDEDVLTLAELYALLEVNTALTDNEKGLVSSSLVSAHSAIKSLLGYDPVQELRTEYYPLLNMASAGGSVWDVSDTHAYQRSVSGTGTEELQLRHVPIRVIQDLRIDHDGRHGRRSGSFADSTEKTEGVDFWRSADMLDSEDNPVSEDGILRSHGLWPTTPGSVKITYIAGYSAGELRGEDALIDASPIREAIIDETIRRVHRYMARAKQTATGFSGPLSSENLGDYSYSVNTGAISSMMGNSDLSGLTTEKLAPFMRYDMGVM